MKNLKVLIVDDSEMNCDLMERILKKLYTVKKAYSGEEAIETIYSTYFPDLILLDVSLPGMSGFEVCETLKKDPKTSDIPIIFITGYTNKKDIVQGLNLGAVDYVTKPFDIDELSLRVKTHMELKLSKKKIVEINTILNNELKWAGELQKKIIEIDLPESDKISFNIDYQALPQLKCGGDYYDIFKFSDDEFLVLLGDVTGHGLKSAFITMILKAVVYHDYIKNNQKIFDISDFFYWLNSRLNFELQRIPEIFVAFAGIHINLKEMKLYYCNAGLPGLYIKRMDKIISKKLEGMLLGIEPDQRYGKEVIDIMTGDRIIFFTDGLNEIGTSHDDSFLDEVFLAIDDDENFNKATFIKVKELFNADSFLDDVTLLTMKIM